MGTGSALEELGMRVKKNKELKRIPILLDLGRGLGHTHRCSGAPPAPVTTEGAGDHEQCQGVSRGWPHARHVL